MSIDGGSINSSIRIELDKLSGDVLKVEKIYDNLDKNIKTTLKRTEDEIKNVAKVTVQGGITQETAIKRVIALREKQIKAIQDNAVKNKGATADEITQIKRLEGEIEKLGGSLEKSTKTTDKQTDSFNKMAAQTALVALAVVGVKKAISLYADTEQKLANVQAVTNATAKEFELLKKAANDAGETTRFTASDAADALYSLSSAGLDATQSIAALDGVLLLAGATGSDLDFTAKTMTATLSQFSLESSKAADISNIFAAASANSQANMEKLSNAFKQAGPIAGQFGLTVEETTANLEALFNAGLTGEASGTAIRNILLTLADSGSKVSKAFVEAGGSIDDINPRTVGLTGAMEALASSGIDLSAVFEKETVAAALTLGKAAVSTEDNLRDLQAAITDTDEAARQYATQNDTLAGSQDKFTSALQGTSNSFVEQLTPAIRFFLDIGAGLLKIINKIPDVLKAVGAGAVTAGLGVFGLSKALAFLPGVFSAIGVSLAGALGPITLVAGLVVGLTAIVSKAKEVRQSKLSEEFGDLARELGYAGESVDKFVGNVDKIQIAFKAMAASGQSFEHVERLIDEMSKKLKISKEEVVDIALKSKDVSSEYKTQLTTIKNQIIQQEDLQALLMSQVTIEKAIELSKINQQRTEAKIAKEKELSEQIDKDRIKRLSEIQKEVETLDELSSRGAINEIDLLKEKSKLRQEEIDLLILQALTSGEVSDSVIADIEAQKKKIKEYEARLITLTKTEEKQGEDKKAIYKSTVKSYEDVLEQMAEAGGGYIKQDVKATEEGEEDKVTSYIEAGTKIVGLAQDIYNALINSKIASINREIEEIERLTETQLDAIDTETEALIVAQGLQEETKLESLQRQLDAVNGVTTTELENLNVATQKKLADLGLLEDTKLQSLQKQLDKAILDGDTETANELKNSIARTKILEGAELEKDKINKEALAKELEDEIARTKIIEDAEARKKAIEEKAAKDTANLKYEADVAQWEASKVNATITGAQAAVQVYSSLALFGPIVAGLGAAASLIATGVYIDQINKSKPVKQTFATGGIVLPEPGKSLNGDQHLVGVNPKELVLTEEQQAELYSMAKGNNRNSQGGSFTFILEVDGRQQAKSVVNYINNGKVRLKAK